MEERNLEEPSILERLSNQVAARGNEKYLYPSVQEAYRHPRHLNARIQLEIPP